MCYQTRQIRTVKDLELRYDRTLASEQFRDLFDRPSYHLNGFSHPNMLVIPQEKEGVLAPGVWGIVPSNKRPEEIKAYYKESVRYGSGLNARSEKLLSHFIYRDSIMSRRCIIPVTGFFEPHEHKGNKYPIHIRRKDETLFSLAGIYTVIGNHITFTILTKNANPYFEKIHNKKKRQPVILNPEFECDWLNSELASSEITAIVKSESEIDDFEAYPVSKDIYRNNVDSNREDITSLEEYQDFKFYETNK